MLTELKAYSGWRSVPILPLSDTGRAETDLIQITNIEGLDPVKASVNSSPLGSVDGVAYVGSSVLARNIVLTLRPNPDWNEWSYEGLRRLLYSYFVPKKPVRLEFYSDDVIPVMIEGIVESAEANLFSKDPEFVVSVICPNPYFTSIEPIVLTGLTILPSSEAVIEIDYKGNIESGIHVVVTYLGDPVPSKIGIQVGDPLVSFFEVAASVETYKYFEMSSVPTQKYVQNVDLNNGTITNLLSKINVREGSAWPVLQPGINEFSVITDVGTQDWQLTYYERLGGL